MPPIDARSLLRPAPAGELDERPVKVVVPFGLHRLVYTVPMYCVKRVVHVDALRSDAHPTQWLVLQSQCGTDTIPASRSPPDLRGTGVSLLYKTAGAYHNSIDAENELKHLPSRGNKRTAVVTSDDERADQEGTPPSAKEEEDGAAASDASSDTSYDSDDQPKPKKKKCKQPSKPRARRKKRVQKPAHVEYRSSIRNQQSIDNVPTFSADHLGSELCMVIAQLFREFTRVGTFNGLTSVFLHPHADWLEALEVQATASRNTWMAHAAHVLRVAQAAS